MAVYSEAAQVRRPAGMKSISLDIGVLCLQKYGCRSFYFSSEVIHMSNDKAAGVSGLNEKEKALIKLLRNIKYGDVRIIVKDGIPIRAEQVTKSIVF